MCGSGAGLGTAFQDRARSIKKVEKPRLVYLAVLFISVNVDMYHTWGGGCIRVIFVSLWGNNARALRRMTAVILAFGLNGDGTMKS